MGILFLGYKILMYGVVVFIALSAENVKIKSVQSSKGENDEEHK